MLHTHDTSNLQVLWGSQRPMLLNTHHGITFFRFDVFLRRFSSHPGPSPPAPTQPGEVSGQATNGQIPKVSGVWGSGWIFGWLWKVHLYQTLPSQRNRWWILELEAQQYANSARCRPRTAPTLDMFGSSWLNRSFDCSIQRKYVCCSAREHQVFDGLRGPKALVAYTSREMVFVSPWRSQLQRQVVSCWLGPTWTGSLPLTWLGNSLSPSCGPSVFSSFTNKNT